MSFLEIKEQACKLPIRERLALVRILVTSLEEKDFVGKEEPLDKKRAAILRMKGMLQTDQLPPTDEDVQKMLEEKRYCLY